MTERRTRSTRGRAPYLQFSNTTDLTTCVQTLAVAPSGEVSEIDLWRCLGWCWAERKERLLRIIPLHYKCWNRTADTNVEGRKLKSTLPYSRRSPCKRDPVWSRPCGVNSSTTPRFEVTGLYRCDLLVGCRSDKRVDIIDQWQHIHVKNESVMLLKLDFDE